MTQAIKTPKDVGEISEWIGSARAMRDVLNEEYPDRMFTVQEILLGMMCWQLSEIRWRLDHSG